MAIPGLFIFASPTDLIRTAGRLNARFYHFRIGMKLAQFSKVVEGIVGP